MRTTTIEIKSLFLGILLGGCVVFALGAGANNAGRAVWEYKIVPGNVLEGQLEKVLNTNVAEGWELVSTSHLVEHWGFVVLKREKK